MSVRAYYLLLLVIGTGLGSTGLARSETPRDPLVSIVRTIMLSEAVIPDVNLEFAPGEAGVGTTLGWPLLLRIGAIDLGELTTRKHLFALLVGEPQLALGRGLAPRFRGLASARIGGGSYSNNTSIYLEGGYLHSQRHEESGAVVGVGLGYLPQHMASIGVVLRYYRGEEARFALGLDLSLPLNLWLD